MPLKFECNQDPRKMKTVNGKKFCQLCRKNVYDVRKKSIHKIFDLKKQLGTCCVFIRKDQLAKIDKQKRSGKILLLQRRRILPVAASLSFLTLSPLASTAQDQIIIVDQQTQSSRDSQGKKTITNQQQLTKQKITFTGKIKDSGRRVEGITLRIGYYAYDSIAGSLFYPYAEVTTGKKGKFSFSLTSDELTMFQQNTFGITNQYNNVHIIHYDLNDLKEKIIIKLEYIRQYHGGVLD